MTRYIVACKTEVYGDRLLLRLGDDGIYSVPLKAFVSEEPMEPEQQVVIHVTNMTMHRICGLIDRANARIKELERENRALREGGSGG